MSYRKGHRFLLIVTCHVTGRVVWARPGRNQDTLRVFFNALTQQRAAALTHVSCDGAEWIHDVITARAPQATMATDNHIRRPTRQAYAFHTPEALIAMVELTRGGLCPPLPGRTT